jgi:hypothetical protein
MPYLHCFQLKQVTMNSTMTWTPFCLIDKVTLSERTLVGVSTFTNWRTSRISRIRYLEYGVYFNLLSASEKTALINDPALKLVKLLEMLSPNDHKLTQRSIADITGESSRTLRNWWDENLGKRALCLELILGVVGMLLVANQPKYSIYWPTTEKENAYKQYAFSDLSSIIDIKAFEKWKFQ